MRAIRRIAIQSIAADQAASRGEVRLPPVRALACLAFNLAFAWSAASNAAPPADIDAYADQVLDRFAVPGMAVTIVEDSGITLARGYGVRELGRPARVDEHTLFPIGSNTKAFTSAALAILVDEGKLRWSDRVVDRLPGFQMYDPYVTREMTIRDLLTHRSGLGTGAGDLLFVPRTTFTRDEIVRRLRYIKPASSFRSEFSYNNLMYVVAGQVIEKVSGMSWEDFVSKRIFQPVGMKDSAALEVRVNTANRVALHARTDGPMRGMGTQRVLERGLDLEAVAAAGDIHSSAQDMARWLQVQLNSGSLAAPAARLFSAAQGREMWTPRIVIPLPPASGPQPAGRPNVIAYALGWGMQDYRGQQIMLHTGVVFGASCIVAVVPAKRVAIAVMVNAEEEGAFGAMLNRLLDHYLQLPSEDWIGLEASSRQRSIERAKQALDAGAAAHVANTTPSLPLQKYTGVYRDPWYGTVTVSQEAAELAIRFDHSEGMSSVLEHWHYDTFRTHWHDRAIEDAFVTFTLDASGAVDGIKMQAVSPLADPSFDYADLSFAPSVKAEASE